MTRETAVYLVAAAIALTMAACTSRQAMIEREHPTDPTTVTTHTVDRDEAAPRPEPATRQAPNRTESVRKDKGGRAPAEKKSEMVCDDLSGALMGAGTGRGAGGMSRAKIARRGVMSYASAPACAPAPAPYRQAGEEWNTESYAHIAENGFRKAIDNPLSTFSIDVDAASYANVRRFLTGNSLPPKDAVRIEELVNYFNYDYPQPTGEHPFSITTEVGPCPWNDKHEVVHVGLQGAEVDTKDLPPSNLVFLLDVSGSMNSPSKLPLLKKAMKLLVRNLRDEDRVAITVYAGAAGLVLPSTAGENRDQIIAALDRLSAGGSTAGGAGIKLAYTVAKEHFMEKGNNRVILCTDGDFNVGASSDAAMVRLIEQKRDDGIFLTVLGFGTGNYKDSKMEQLADKGNGNYAYIDNLLEAKKVLVKEMGGTLVTIAKDVKIQVEFNPAAVQAYRLVGYENRVLKNEDFNDDTKDAGELGAGHTVTALYEIVPTGVKSTTGGDIDPLKYQTRTVGKGESGELLTVKFRYKKADGNTSRLIVHAVKNEVTTDLSDNYRFSAAVAGFGMLLRDSEHSGQLSWDQVIEMARDARGRDRDGYRSEFIRMVERAQLLASDRRS